MSDLLHSTPASSAARTGTPVLSAHGLAKSYRMGGTTVDVLREVDLELYAGESVAIMGRSGSGKSTLLHLFGLLDRPDSGDVMLGGTSTRRLSAVERSRMRNREVGFIFQSFHLLRELSALQNVLLPFMVSTGTLSWLLNGGEHRARARALLEEMGLAERARHRPSQLSGGERQRVAIARALVTRPSLLLCDEPTGNLDELTSELVADQLFELTERHGHTMVIVTHEEDIARRADRVFTLHEGTLAPL